MFVMILNFLILDGCMLWFLVFCVKKIGENLKYLEMEYEVCEESYVQVDVLCYWINVYLVDMIFEEGLYEFFSSFIVDNVKLVVYIEEDFRFYG